MSAKPKLDPRGLKRICTNCGGRFYDMNKRPIICPSCDTEFLGEIKIKGKRGKAAANDKAESQVTKATEKEEDNEDDATDTDDEAVVSLDEAADLEAAGDDIDDDTPAPDLDMDDDIADLDDIDADLDVDDDLDDIDADIPVAEDEKD